MSDVNISVTCTGCQCVKTVTVKKPIFFMPTQGVVMCNDCGRITKYNFVRRLNGNFEAKLLKVL